MLEFKVKSLPQLLIKYSDEQKCIEFFEQLLWDGQPVSPFDKSSKVYKCKGHQYLCRNTNKHFNVKTGTILENTKLKLNVWIAAIWLFTNHKLNYSSMQLSRDYNYVHVSKKHLQKYVDESIFRRFSMKFEPNERFIYLMCNIQGRLRYKDLIREVA